MSVGAPLRRRLHHPPAPTARRQHPKDVAGLELDRAFVPEALRPRLVSIGQQPALPHRTRLAAGQTPRLRDEALRDQRDRARLKHLEIALDALPAGRQAGTATPPPEALTKDPQRVGALKCFYSVLLGFVELEWTPQNSFTNDPATGNP
jgi:hypothetical protein